MKNLTSALTAPMMSGCSAVKENDHHISVSGFFHEETNVPEKLKLSMTVLKYNAKITI